MLLYSRRAQPKAPKRRSRAGCIHCKEKKKKCNEVRPQCDRCIEKGLECGYEAVKPRKRRKTSFAGSALARQRSEEYYENWPQYGQEYDGFDLEDGEPEWNLASKHQYQNSENPNDWAIEDLDVEEIKREPIVALDTVGSGSMVQSRSRYPDLAMIAPSPTPSPLLEFTSPVFGEFTNRKNRRVLVDHFCNVLSHLIVFKEDTGNPFRQLVLPLSHSSSPVLNAIFALSSAHLEYRGIQNQEKSLNFHNKAIQGLSKLIERNDPSVREEVLGAIILLIYYEVLVQRSDSSIVNGHLKGAMTIMKTGPQVNTPTTAFLERAFRFYDVIAALSLGTSPNNAFQPPSRPFQCPAPPTAPFPLPPSMAESIHSSPLESVDPLLGLSTSLWPIIHRLSLLLPQKRLLENAIATGQMSQAVVLRGELASNSSKVEHALLTWVPTLPQTLPEPSTTEHTRLLSIIHNALAYQHSALVYLYRTVQDLPRSAPHVQEHVHTSLISCYAVVEHAEQCGNGPMSALLWPLFVASVEATAENGDRELAHKAFGSTERRQGMINIWRGWDVVQEVWTRIDQKGGDPRQEVDWRDVCEEKCFDIVFG